MKIGKSPGCSKTGRSFRSFWDARAERHGSDACHYLDFWRDAFAYLSRWRVLRNIGFAAPILELGAGVGQFAWLWPSATFLDHSEPLLSRHPGRNRVCGDAARLPFRVGHFQSVVAITAMQFLADPCGALREIRRILKPGGMIVFLDDFSPSQKPWHDKPYKNWHPAVWWDRKLADFRTVKVPVTALDQKLFALLGSGLLQFCLSMLLEPVWGRFAAARYECWVGTRQCSNSE